ncbi:TPM domain-containing protein [Akkermansiaceae bacterium]|nr:TPM domain-containing protein [Akkermansiaceae bacterium]
MFGGISDGCQLFGKSETKKLAKIIRGYQESFPQSRLHVVTRTFDQKVDLPVILFWVFNRAGLSEESAKQGQNRDVVILIEPHRNQAAMIVGYGLEPVLPQQALDQIIERAQPFLGSGDYLGGMEIAIDSLTELLKSVSQKLQNSLGLKSELAKNFAADDF